ncbi:hypothetical protein EDL99_09410 [Ornithobacterium rhinotracheale]|uniref:hypothetical protein n=1 Tax=Ornithobacterium rhinotracheale TaxID=28251 RepID=UPI00129CD512|nr:hypothetical protein [Ornithobacterium rhinotracheale]MRJ09076.1 hypothetical protein [Ornithobacterium rhinotracheale]UOH77847.1 hypothetical protein MT996_11685 [Ornithobacterium rhinotracheale]
MKHWSYYLEDKGGRIQDLSVILCQKMEKVANLKRLYFQEMNERDAMEQELRTLMGSHWSQEEINKAREKAYDEWNTVRKTVEIPQAIEEAMEKFLATLEPKDNIVEFMKWSLYEYISKNTGLEVSRMKLHHYLKEYCRKKGYVYMPDGLRIQKDYNGQIMDFIQIRIK